MGTGGGVMGPMLTTVVMGPMLTTVVVECRALMREALEALLIKYSYRVVCGVASAADIDSSVGAADAPKLVILGTQSADHAVTEAIAIRKLWPKSKIILLFEDVSPGDFQKFLASEINGCIPLSVSPDTLIGTLGLILISDIRAMVVTDANGSAIEPSGAEDSHQPWTETDKLRSDDVEHADISAGAISAMEQPQPTLNGTSTVDLSESSDSSWCLVPRTILAGLSERELQILDGLVKGHANKVIARTCDITEATVKVHMKSILRKIRATNRTQAAIWALKNGFSVDEIKHACATVCYAIASFDNMVSGCLV
jgi:two-component system, NarL family, nitrate/nitrite response regulator NarL